MTSAENNCQPGVLLLNLGSPDSAAVPDVRRYLKEFLLDERVIDAPWPIRQFVVRALILPRRPRESAKAYASIWEKGGSPLILTTEKQRAALQETCSFPVAMAMRYGTPSIPDVIRELKEKGVTDLFLVPLYPHYAMSSYETVVVKVMETLKAKAPAIRATLLQPFYRDEDYIEALVESAKPWLENDYDHLLFSFHGIPERHLRKSDPSHAHCLSTPDCCNHCHPAHATCYRHQCFSTVNAFVEKAGIPDGKYSVSFQSRLGRDPWLRPYTDHVLEELAHKGVKKLRVICPAFISDCLETLEEIAMEGKSDFLAAGGEYFEQIPCLNDQAVWIEWLSKRVDLWLETLPSKE